MTAVNRTTLKSYFIKGATLDEADFSNLIDSTFLSEDLINDITADLSATRPLGGQWGEGLIDSFTQLSDRVVALEQYQYDGEHYTKAEVDTKLNGVDNYINSLSFASDISGLQSDMSTTVALVNSKADSVHNQPISTITGLQEALDQKATISELNSIRDSLIASINDIQISDETAEVTGLQASIDQINATIATLATKAELGLLVGPDHDHLVEDLDLSGYYTKTEVDTKISAIVVPAHTHEVSAINGLGTEIQNKTNLLLQDHTGLTDNPHSVTKEQVGLDKVENMTPTEMVTAAGGLTADLVDTLETKVDDHIGAINPHNINKTHVSLGNVPNVNVEQLLTAHIAEENPHNVDISTFDVYTTAESDQKVQDYINAKRYPYTPTSTTDTSGDPGDFAYDSNAVFFRGAVNWGRMLLHPMDKLSFKIGDIEPLVIDDNGNVAFPDTTYLEVPGSVSFASSKFTVDADGNMDITGNADISGSLDVASTINSAASLLVGASTVAATNDANPSGGIDNYSIVTRSIVLHADPNNAADQSTIRFNVDGIERMLIDSNGKLDVYGLIHTNGEEVAVKSYVDTTRTDFQSADTQIRSDFEAADSILRGDFESDDAQIVSDFQAADTQVRTDFASADTQIRTDFASADTQVRTDFASADTQIRNDLALDLEALKQEIISNLYAYG